MNGKSKCRLLKQIRQQIARNNGIDYVTSECKYQGDCTGTCPKCEAEVRYLEQELSKRKQLGRTVAVAGVAAALVVGMSGCGLGEREDSHRPTLGGAILAPTQVEVVDGSIDPGVEYMGEPTTQPEQTEPSEELILMGDIALPEIEP